MKPHVNFKPYVPGNTQRHPEGLFSAICETAQSGMSVDELTQCQAFATGLQYLDQGYYWEAHEVLEPVWLALPEGSDERQVIRALIQLANAHLKLCMNRPKATLRLCGIVTDLLETVQTPMVMTINVATLQQKIDALKSRV